jgi:Adenylate and Guanylate cyclase catalytic domain
LTIYPSLDTENEFVNNEPVFFTTTIVSGFLFTFLVLLVYDWHVARRQRIVLDRAIASGAIVSSLFPSQVSDIVYKICAEKRKLRLLLMLRIKTMTMKSMKTTSFSLNQMQFFFRKQPLCLLTRLGVPLGARPVDRSKSSRCWKRFIAHLTGRRRVFEVETIGDCYVAVAGLPNPQQDHALVMVKFAKEILGFHSDQWLVGPAMLC